jgi:hypothetical protein
MKITSNKPTRKHNGRNKKQIYFNCSVSIVKILGYGLDQRRQNHQVYLPAIRSIVLFS